MDVWFWSLWKDRFSGGGHEEHSDSGKNEERHAEGRGEKPHAWLFKLPRRAGKEEDRSKEHGVGKVLARAIARLARLDDPPRCVGPPNWIRSSADCSAGSTRRIHTSTTPCTKWSAP